MAPTANNPSVTDPSLVSLIPAIRVLANLLNMCKFLGPSLEASQPACKAK